MAFGCRRTPECVVKRLYLFIYIYIYIDLQLCLSIRVKKTGAPLRSAPVFWGGFAPPSPPRTRASRALFSLSVHSSCSVFLSDPRVHRGKSVFSEGRGGGGELSIFGGWIYVYTVGGIDYSNKDFMSPDCNINPHVMSDMKKCQQTLWQA